MLPTTPQGWRTLTGIVEVTLLALLGAYDVLARVKGGQNATVTICTFEWSQICPVLPFIAGFIAGHIFWRV